MSNPSVLHLNRAEFSTMFRARNELPLALVEAGSNRRAKIWEISPSLHCSIIGTCLSAAELRQFFVRFGDKDARTASDHTLHGRGVVAAGQRSQLGKLLHKALDNHHESAVKRFAKAARPAQLREIWREAFEQGAIAGAYWAVLTHPATDRPLVEEVFGQVHMLSHMVGSSSRMDITRLRQLERDLGGRDEKIVRQQARLSQSAGERATLLRKIATLEDEIRRRAAAAPVTADTTAAIAAAASLQQRLDAEKAHAVTLASRVAELEEQVLVAQKTAANLQQQNDRLQEEVTALEAVLGSCDTAARIPEPASRDLTGLTLLYVGGRPGLIDQLKQVTARHGGTLLSHDGGIEENVNVLPGLLSRADAALFPVDCISHAAAGQIKKLCRDAGKPFIPLRTASVASFVAATGAGAALDQLRVG